MKELPAFCSIHPYFRVKPERMDSFSQLMTDFVERTQNEEGVIFYGFTCHGNEVLCREAYINAHALLHHLDNVADLLDEASKIAELTRLEIHGSEADITHLREPLAKWQPDFYTFKLGFIH
ncbi:putative quinol monooxygenase [Endozoicomonas elysicola]|uniref:ABM domain-containing protein n=1 Tax=Endozoicomonas elysicola TaxID=305900 RepID=A0A081KF71_9GAMM|nr:hypothetical protein [Endozoicomonas elysicola]KEI72797.1 hypothetical protein GV64_20585 [Endozoicomonas elysicola]